MMAVWRLFKVSNRLVKLVKMNIKSKLLNFVSETSGNIAIMSAISLPVLLGVVGVAVTMADVNGRESKLQNHSDNLSLLMAKQKNDTTGEKARDAFNEYVATELREGESCTYELETSATNVTTAAVSCVGSMASFLPPFMGLDSVDYKGNATATVSAKIFEVAFVFDISDSMVGAEMEELRATLVEMQSSVLFEDDESKLSLIPFANTVRLGDRFERFVQPGTGYAKTNGVYTGCFDREATDPTVNLRNGPGFPLVNEAIASGRVVCPNEDMEAVFHVNSMDWEVRDMAQNIELAFGTAMSDALVWGHRSLDPDLKGLLSNSSQYPLKNTVKTSKHLIMMTDGKPYDRPYEGPGGGAVTQQISLDRFERVCSQLEFDDKGINFHLINFNNKRLSNEALAVYEDCVRGEGRVYHAEAGELAEVLARIAEEVSTLRISR